MGLVLYLYRKTLEKPKRLGKPKKTIICAWHEIKLKNKKENHPKKREIEKITEISRTMSKKMFNDYSEFYI